jgi:hypothetical protein
MKEYSSLINNYLNISQQEAVWTHWEVKPNIMKLWKPSEMKEYIWN